MAWSHLPATSATDWQSVDFVNELIAAGIERGINWSLITAGTDIQKYQFWSGLQSGLQNRCTAFLNSHDYPAGFDGETSFTLYTLSSWRSAAGLNASGFTRKFPRTINPSSPPTGSAGQRAYAGTQNSEVTRSSTGATHLIYEHNGSSWSVADDQVSDVDVITYYGLMQAGDYIGIWIFNELYAGFNELRWTYTAFDPGTDTNSSSGQVWAGNDDTAHDTFAEARSHVESLYAYFGNDTLGETNIASRYVRYGPFPPYKVKGYLLQQLGRYVMAVYPTYMNTHLAHDCDVYAIPTVVPGREYNDDTLVASNGPGVLALMATLGVALTETRTTPVLSNGSTYPTWPSIEDYGQIAGCRIDRTNTFLVFRWDVPGGLQYVT